MRISILIFIANLAHFGFTQQNTGGSSILCYECDSNEDLTCPEREKFNPEINPLVDCGSFEARVPGQMCVKIKQESPGWWGWIKITRRCGLKSDLGVAQGCRYWFQDNGVFREFTFFTILRWYKRWSFREFFCDFLCNPASEMYWMDTEYIVERTPHN